MQTSSTFTHTSQKRMEASGAILNPISMDLITQSSQKKHKQILAVCSNDLTSLIAKSYKDCLVVGVDINQEHFNITKKLAEESGLTNIELNLCDPYNLKDLKHKHSKLFDVVHDRFTLTHQSDPEKIADQMLSMVKPGGILIIEECSERTKFYGKIPKCIDAWLKLLEFQYELQKSNKNTIDRVYKHFENSDQICLICSKVFSFTIEGPFKKSNFRLDAEEALMQFEKKGNIEILKRLGYEDGKTWIDDLTKFELDDTQTLQVHNFEAIVAYKSSTKPESLKT